MSIMLRYFIKPKQAVLNWLLELDSTPKVLPVFPKDTELGLVVAHLVSGKVFAEVLPDPRRVAEACGQGIPMGRLYFQIPRDRLYSVCPELTQEVFRG